MKDLEVDHKVGNHSLQDIGDIQSFIEGITLVTEDDLAFVSKEAHKSKSYADKHGISFEEAVAIRKAIEICKNKQDKRWLEERGVVPESNAVKRRAQIEEILKNESQNY